MNICESFYNQSCAIEKWICETRTNEVSESALFSAYNVSRLFAQFYEKKLKQFGITYSQYLVYTDVMGRESSNIKFNW